MYGGTEQERADDVPQLGNDIYGARFGAQWYLDETFSLFANAAGERRQYGGPDPYFLVDRKDTQYSASGGHELLSEEEPAHYASDCLDR